MTANSRLLNAERSTGGPLQARTAHRREFVETGNAVTRSERNKIWKFSTGMERNASTARKPRRQGIPFEKRPKMADQLLWAANASRWGNSSTDTPLSQRWVTKCSILMTLLLGLEPCYGQVNSARAFDDQIERDAAARSVATTGSASAQLPVGVAQIRTIPALLPTARDLPSGLKATTSTRPWLGSAASCFPVSKSHTRTTLSPPAVAS